jgi:hypothetical protein
MRTTAALKLLGAAFLRLGVPIEGSEGPNRLPTGLLTTSDALRAGRRMGPKPMKNHEKPYTRPVVPNF